MSGVLSVHKFSQCITCHAWSPDHSMIALCPNTEEVHIYKASADKWEKIHVLQKHDQVVCGIDWSSKTNKIVTVSHDRNSYVWNQEGEEWVPTLVILRLNRAALCVQWSPRENKFAVGSGAKTVCICYYEQENNWWVSKLIRKKHNSSVTSVAWHPNNVLLATTSTDGKCRVFSTFIKGIDTRDSEAGSSSDKKFGEQIIQLDLSYSWAFGVKWSPSGNTLAYVVIGVGFDCNPMVFAADESGLWGFVRFLGQTQTTPTSARAGSQISAFGKLYGQSKYGYANDDLNDSNSRGRAHENCITCIVPMKKGKESKVTRFSTSGLDGKVVIWDLGSQDLGGFI